MGKGGKSTQKVVQEIPPFLQNQLTQTYNLASDIQPAVFAGERVAGFNPLQTLAQQLTADRALAGDPTVQKAQTMLGDTLSGNFLENPFLSNQIDNAISGAVNQATSQYALGGRLGSGAFGTALGAGITGAAAPILANQYEAERGRMMQAAQMAPTLAQQDFLNLQALSDVGAQQQSMSQAQIQAQQDFINELNAAQMSKLNALATATGLAPSATNSTTTGGQKPGTVDTISQLGSTAALMAMAFSDERMKENINQIEDPIKKVNMLDGVTFNYKGQPQQSAGLLAQDVERVLPMAVAEQDNGMKAVNYAQVTGLLTEAVKDLSRKVNMLEARAV